MKKYNPPFRTYANKRIETPPTPAQPSQTPNATVDRKIYCKHCDCGFDSETETEVHKWQTHQGELLNSVSGKSRQICLICLKRFKTAEKLNLHVRRAHLYMESAQVTKINRPIYICNECHLMCFNKAMFLLHMRHRHEYLSSKVPLNCPKCDKLLKVRAMIQHFDYVHYMRSVKTCPICLAKQASVAGVPRHVLKEHPPVFVCHFCRHRANDASSLNVHMRQAHGKQESRGAVPSEVEFLKYFTVNKRKLAHHSPGLQFPDRELNLRNMLHICVLCQEVVDTKFDMKHHVASAHGHSMLEGPRPPAPKACHCGASFRTDVLLRHHIFQHHTQHHSVEKDDDEYELNCKSADPPSPVVTTTEVDLL